ncbi:conserved hypothetical protein [Neospora caninum Liverpool]|uniref:Uncharacterized protein n=1 Tax=Neospora caninum (strain Liverpool) TaxID=572307 RepID=F0VGR9_NEOCL|nr:conserved hypothetical protein [Neospora caninum Liverpool]CBZ52913.1 conserved hypothetical protein [Neospora caninum Liverpool]CEL66895.1 TPA: hypothetical protein BN1204_027010 [Neospora caninum Liverpool]|eukprot:XP_003882945.1 conserved hypothetical protein [Neospora caninum Liverpool]
MEDLDQATLARLAAFLYLNEVPKLRLLSKGLNERLFAVDAFRRLMREPRVLIFPADWGRERLESAELHEKRVASSVEPEGSQRHSGTVTKSPEIQGDVAAFRLPSEDHSAGSARQGPLADFNFLRTLVSLPPPSRLLHLTLHIPAKLKTVTRSWLRTYHQLLCVAAPHLETLRLIELFSASLGNELVRVRQSNDADEEGEGSEDETPGCDRAETTAELVQGPDTGGEDCSPGSNRDSDEQVVHSECTARDTCTSLPFDGDAVSPDTSCSGPTPNQQNSVPESGAVAADSETSQEQAQSCSCWWTPPRKHEALPLPAFPRLRSLTVLNRGEWSGRPPVPCAFSYLFLGDLQASADGSGSLSASPVSTASTPAFPLLKDIRFLEFTTVGLELFQQFLVKHNVTSAEHLAIGTWSTTTLNEFLLFLIRENAKPKERFRDLKSLDIHGARFIWPPDEFWYFFYRSWCDFTQIWKEHFTQQRSDANRRDARRRALTLRDAHWTACPADWSTCPPQWDASSDALLMRVNGRDRDNGGHTPAPLCGPAGMRDEDSEEDEGALDVGLPPATGGDGRRDRGSIIRMLKRLPCLRRVLLSGFVGIFVGEEADEAIRFFEDIFPEAVVDVEGELVVSTNFLLEIAAQATPHPDWALRLETFMARKRERRRTQNTGATESVGSERLVDLDQNDVSVVPLPVSGSAGGSGVVVSSTPAAQDSEGLTPNATEPERDTENEGQGREHDQHDDQEWAAVDGAFVSERGKENLSRWLALGVVKDVYVEMSHTPCQTVHLQVSSFHRRCVATYFGCLGLQTPVTQRPVGQDWGLPFLSVRHVVQWGTKYVQDFLDIATTFRHVILNLDYIFWEDRGDDEESGSVKSLASEKGEISKTAEKNRVRSETPRESTGTRAQDVQAVTNVGASGDQESRVRQPDDPQLVPSDPHQCCGTATPDVVGGSSRNSDTVGENLVSTYGTPCRGDRDVVRLGEFGAHFTNVIGLLLPMYMMDGATWSADEIARIAEKYRYQTRVLCVKNAIPMVGEYATEADPLSLMARDFDIVTRICRDTLRVIDYRVYSFFSWEDELGLDDKTLVPSFLKAFVETHREFTLAKRLDFPPMTQTSVPTVGKEALCQLRVYIWIKREVL